MKIPQQLAAEYTFSGLRIAVLAAIVALTMVAAFGVAAVQTVRVDGIKILFVEREGWKPRAERLQAELDRVPEQQAEARRKAEAAKAAQEQTYSDIAKEVDENAEDELARQLAAADRYVAAHRVRAQAAADRGGRSAPAAGGDRAGDGEEAGRAAELDDARGIDRASGADRDLVVVAAEDVRICTVNTIQAEAARDWALQLEAASRPGD